jgi:hypothetical protein
LRVSGYELWLAIVAPVTWTLPEAFSTFWRLTKPGVVPEKAKVTAWGQLGVLVTLKFV